MTPAAPSTKWIRCYTPRPNATLRLVCVPFAGGGASAFREWGNLLPSTVEVWGIQAPGREERLAEDHFTSRVKLVEALAEVLAPRLTGRFCLFGHSLGARIAFELARALRQRGARAPEHLFVSGRSAPHLPPTRPPLHHLPHEEFLAELRKFNGTPQAVFDEPELLELLIPLLRADFQLNDVDPHVDDAPFAFPITALGGNNDEHANEERVAAWRSYTTGAFVHETFEGDHFFIASERRKVLEKLAGWIAPYTR